MATERDNEGYRLSELPSLDIPFQPGDIAEIIRTRVKNPERYENLHFSPDPLSIPLATVSKHGSFILGQNSVTSDTVLAALTELLEARMVAGEDITLDYNESTGILTISAGTAPPVDTSFRIIGKWAKYGAMDVVEGFYYAVSYIYNIQDDVVESLVQRPKVVYEGEELENLMTLATTGGYAICGDVTIDESDKLFITNYVTDEAILESVEWEANEVSPSPIVIDANSNLNTIMVLGPNKFAVIARVKVGDVGITNCFQIVTFSSPDVHQVHTITFDVNGFGDDTQVAGNNYPTVAANLDDNELCAVYKGVVGGENAYFRALFDISDYTLISLEYFIDIGVPVSPLSGLTNPTETCLVLTSSSAYYRTFAFSYDGYMGEGSFTNYGGTFNYRTYSNRVLDVNYVGYDDLSDPFEIQPPVNAKILAIGLTPNSYDDGEGGTVTYEQAFGLAGAFIS